MDFTYNEEEALQGGAGGYISQTGAYKGKITGAKWAVAQSGAEAIELSFESDNGEKADYLSIYYKGKDGNAIEFGRNLIQAVMGCAGVTKLSQVPNPNGYGFIAPELVGRPVGLFLQKVLYTKQDGSDGFKFQVITPFSAKSGLTLAEHKNGEPAKRVPYLVQTMRDKDEREKPKRGRPPKLTKSASDQPKNHEVMTADEMRDVQQFNDDCPF